ncbi:MAG TPA: hypothetical protein VFH94_16520 [Streptomyces sp.]|nr:hypothetical protein [Streptomyces sp.]
MRGAQVLDGRVPHSLLEAFTDADTGTAIVPDTAPGTPVRTTGQSPSERATPVS